jgi:hypothetical protein
MNDSITLTITRLSDEGSFRREHHTAEQVRSVVVEARMDRTSRRLILPRSIAQQQEKILYLVYRNEVKR